MFIDLRVYVLTRNTNNQKNNKLFIMFIRLRVYNLTRNANNTKKRKI